MAEPNPQPEQADLIPVAHDPWSEDVGNLIPVEHEPFGTAPQGNVAGSLAGIVGGLGQRAADWYQRQPSWSDRMAAAQAGADPTRLSGGIDPTEQVGLLGGFVGKTTPKVKAPFSQYATEYPPVQAPDLYSKAAGNPLLEEGADYSPASAASKAVEAGKAYFGKSSTPEAMEFGKARLGIAKQMAQEGYEPYFDPAKRQMVDPADYPSTQAEMTKEALPAKQATIDKYQAMYDTPEGRARIESGYRQGLEVPNSEDWYSMKQLQDEFVRVLGPERGKAAFKTRFADSMAATTGGSDPTSNLLMSQYANVLKNRGDYVPPSHQFPYPIGGRYAGTNMEQFKGSVGDPAFTGFSAENPKRFDFSSAFLGHPGKVTMDEVMTGGLVPGLQMPKPGSYGVASGMVKGMAEKAGVDPTNYQGITWAGLKYQKGLAEWVAKGKDPADYKFDYAGPMINHVNDAIERTHRLTGMPHQKIVEQGLIRQKIPLYTGIGAIGAGAAAEQGDRQ